MKLFGFLRGRRPRPRARSQQGIGVRSTETTLVAGRTLPSPMRMAAPSTGAALPRLPGFDEQTMLTLAGAATVKRVGAGERILGEGERLDSLYAILEGAADITTAEDAHASPVAVLSAGDGIGTLGSVVRSACFALTAREPCLWLQISPAAFNLLPPSTQIAVSRWAAASAFSRLSTLLPRYAAVQREASHLMDYVGARERATRECLAAKAVQDVLADIPRLPPYASDLIGKLLDEKAHGEEIVEAIRNDPSLAALVLKTVNSPYYGLPIKISDYYHAFLHLGTIKVYQLVVTTGIQSALPPTPEARNIQAHSKVISLIAYEIARLSGLVRPELATTVGLLHDVGRSVVPMIQDRHPDVSPLIAQLDPAAVGGALLASWALPDAVVQPIAHQREAEFCAPDRIPVEYRHEVAILYLSHLCYDLLVTQNQPAVPTVHAGACLAALKLNERTHVELCEARIAPALARQAKQLPAIVLQSLRKDLWVETT